jgi:DNA-binding transcriptional MocR family regulator
MSIQKSFDEREQSGSSEANSREWGGRFPRNEIISLLDVNRSFNLAESTSQDLTVGELLSLPGLEYIRALKLGYGTSAGDVALREAISDACKVPAEQIITTQGTALGLFLLAFEVCRSGNEAVLTTPCFPPSRDCLLGAGVSVREVKLSFETGYRLDLEQIGKQLSAKTKLISIASPQNPRGIQTTRPEIEELLALMEARSPEAILFVDETYREAYLWSRFCDRQLCGAGSADRYRGVRVKSARRAGFADWVAYGRRRRPSVAI